ncbi:hypothetical protein DM2_1604 [Halorubrum sp. DM2]|nr:hypothetical protein DM2_1604 [Halorubrum sp. DM2]
MREAAAPTSSADTTVICGLHHLTASTFSFPISPSASRSGSVEPARLIPGRSNRRP